MLSWMELVLRPEHELAANDLVETSLVCACGLPGTQGLDIAACVRRCDEYAERVRNSTFRQAFEKRPEHWDYSWAKFRAHAMIAVLQRQCGFRYNRATEAENFPFRPEDTFVHGLLFGEGGTCASMPVLYAAIGRRLGYPLKLVKAAGKGVNSSHGFCRWDEPGGERFNIETTAADGLCCLPDDYYRTGLYEVSANDERHARLLVSLSPREELAQFVSDRGWFWMDWKQYPAAVNCFAWSWALVPENIAKKNRLIKAFNEWGEGVMRLQPPGFPVLRHCWPPRYFPATLPHDFEQDIIDLKAREQILKDAVMERVWWGPMRQGKRVPNAPTAIEIRHQGGEMDMAFRFKPAGPKPAATGQDPLVLWLNDKSLAGRQWGNQASPRNALAPWLNAATAE